MAMEKQLHLTLPYPEMERMVHANEEAYILFNLIFKGEKQIAMGPIVVSAVILKYIHLFDDESRKKIKAGLLRLLNTRGNLDEPLDDISSEVIIDMMQRIGKGIDTTEHRLLRNTAGGRQE